MQTKKFMNLIHGLDTVQCAYYLESAKGNGINFDSLTRDRENAKQSRSKDPKLVTLGSLKFLLQPFGSSSGYPLIISNEDFKIEMGEYNNPNFFVTFRSQTLWASSVFDLHDKFLAWAGSVGFEPLSSESISRVDYCFDYTLSEIDFDEDSFVSRSSKDSKHREDGRPQTFTFGKGDIVLRVYDKVAEIKQQSGKAWFYELWGGLIEDVWRVEWQVRKPILRSFDIRTFRDLYNKLGDLLKYLSEEHDTMRRANGDSNRSRWPLHPLWLDLQERIKQINLMEIRQVRVKEVALRERETRIAISVYGYLKRVAAIECARKGKEMISEKDALEALVERMWKIHDRLNWEIDVKKRIESIGCGEW